MTDCLKQLNPFEIKAEINSIFLKLKDVNHFDDYLIHFKSLDNQDDKSIIIKLLFKELANAKDNSPLIKFLLLRYVEQEELTTKLWDLIKNPMSTNIAKIIALDILRDIDTDWSYEECENYLENPDELVDEDTKRLLSSAIINPEVQIDFLDFLNSLGEDDKVTLVESLANDYTGDELANILIPVFLSRPETKTGKTALKMLSETKSQLAFHALITANSIIKNSDLNIKKAISTLKLAGIREDNTKEFYSNLLKGSKPYKFYSTFPDGEGNQALIFSRIKSEGRIQFVAVVLNDYYGIRDCFGFNEISKFECDTIIERFYKTEKAVNVKPEEMKQILNYGEEISKNSKADISYEYICWRNLLSDTEINNSKISDYLKSKYKAEVFNKDDFVKIESLDFFKYWFLTENYSDEFDNFINILNSELSKNIEFDIDEYIENEVLNVFYPEEQKTWYNRLLMCSYLYSVSNENDFAKLLYNLYNDVSENKTELLKIILRKSIYEYYVKQKMDNIIHKIEILWVANV